MSLGLQASDGVCFISLPQHDGKCLVVLPPSCQVDVGIQEITDGKNWGRVGGMEGIHGGKEGRVRGGGRREGRRERGRKGESDK